MISVREHLGLQECAQIGALAIKWELTTSGNGFPSDSTINRVLKRKGLIEKALLKGAEYPYFTEALEINNICEADLFGPRYIKGDGKFCSFNVIGLYSHQVHVEPQRSKEDRHVASSLLRCWKPMALPDFPRLDNQLSFPGEQPTYQIAQVGH